VGGAKSKKGLFENLRMPRGGKERRGNPKERGEA